MTTFLRQRTPKAGNATMHGSHLARKLALSRWFSWMLAELSKPIFFYESASTEPFRGAAKATAAPWSCFNLRFNLLQWKCSWLLLNCFPVWLMLTCRGQNFFKAGPKSQTCQRRRRPWTWVLCEIHHPETFLHDHFFIESCRQKQKSPVFLRLKI